VRGGTFPPQAKGRHMKSWSDEERRSIAAEPYRDRERAAGRLPASGRPHDSITLQRNQDYPADSDLCFAIGNSVTRVRLTAGDQEKLRAVLGLLLVRASAGMVSDFLLGLYEDGAAPGEPWSADDQAAISRVRHLLES
jgi:hypothetical protein